MTTTLPSDSSTSLHCPECEYDLTGAPGTRCPWCGWEINIDLLIANARNPVPAVRVGVVLAGILCAIGSAIGAYKLSMRTNEISVRDAVIIGELIIAGLGHIGLAMGAVMAGRRWPMRSGELSTMLTISGCVSVIAAIAGATQFYETDAPPMVVRNATVGGVFEFVLASILFTTPGWMLLILRFISFGEIARDVSPALARTADDEGAPFLIDVCGRFERNEVETEACSSPRSRHPSIEAGIERSWEAECADARVRGARLFNGELARLSSFSSTQVQLKLQLGRTCYRDFVGTNLRQAAEVFSHGMEYLSNPLGISATVITSDGFLVYGRRSQKVVSHPGVLHAIGGMVDTSDRATDGSFNVFGAIRRELKEELGLSTNEIGDVVVVGLVRDLTMLQPELLFDAAISLSRDQLLARFAPSLSEGEHSGLEFLADDDESPGQFIRRAAPMAPVAQAALLLHGRHCWGHEWFEKTSLMLYGDVPQLPRRS